MSNHFFSIFLKCYFTDFFSAPYDDHPSADLPGFVFFFLFSNLLGDSLGCIAINVPVITPLGASHRFAKAVFSLSFSLR